MNEDLNNIDLDEDSAADSFLARQIVRTILDYGVSQTQMLHILKILSCELEDRNVMIDVVKSVNISLGEDVADDQLNQANDDKNKSLVLDI